MARDKTMTADGSVSLWHVSLVNRDWYMVFAKSENDAIRVILWTHFPGMTRGEFRKQYQPKADRVANDTRITTADGWGGQSTKTARRWCRGKASGPFLSNTYDD